MKKDCTHCSDSNKEYNEKNDLINSYKYIYTGIKSSKIPTLLFILSVILAVVSLICYQVALIFGSALLYAAITNLIKNKDLLSKSAFFITIIGFLLSIFIFVIDYFLYI